jgi:hypothetical protein
LGILIIRQGGNMAEEEKSVKDIGALGRIIGIFTSPGETFKSIDQKSMWLVPFLITVILTSGLSLYTMDIVMKDQIARLEARDLSEQQMEAARSQMEGAMKYIGVIIAPVGTLIVWSIFAGVLLFGCNTILGGEGKFKKVFSVVAWSYLVMVLGGVIKTFLIVSKGTSQGVTTSLALLLPMPGIGEKASLLYRFLSRLDIFTIWQIVLWIIGLAVVYRFSTKKIANFVLSLWALYIVIAVLIGSILGPSLGG